MAVIISDDLVIGAGSENTPPFPLAHARIGYETIATEQNVTASSAEAGFPAIAAVNPLTYEAWRPGTLPATWTIDAGTARPADYIGIAAHNMASVSASVVVEYSLDGITWQQLSAFAPADNRPIMLIFTGVVARFWRLNFDASNGTPQIGVIYVGRALQMQRQVYGGLTPISMARRTQYQNNRSETNQFLGRSIIRQGVQTSLSWKNLTARWYRDYFEPFAKAARTTPFFLAWYPSKYPAEVGYCWTTDDLTPSNMGVRDYMEITMNVRGLQDD